MQGTAHLGKETLNFVARVGEIALNFLAFCGKFAIFTLSTFRRIIIPPWRWRLIMRQCVEIGVKSFPIAALTSVFVGMVMVLQTGVQLAKFGSKNYVPGISFIANAREMVPTFCAIVVGARVAASIAAELGTMRVTEQLDAMDLLNVDPLRYLAVPRVMAMTVMLPAISTICLITGFLGGMMVGSAALNIDPLGYYTTTIQFAYMEDIIGGIVKTIFFGAIIALTGCYYGFNTERGAAGVGKATTNAVVVTLVLILVVDYILTTLILAITGLG